MGILKEEYKIAAAFLPNPWKKLTYNDIRKFTKKTSKGFIYRSLDRLIKENLVFTEKVGKSVLYGIDLKTLKSKAYWGFLQEYVSWNSKHIPVRVIENLAKKIKSKFFIFIITGSYARNEQNKDSDLDVVILCEDTTNPRTIYGEIKLESDLSDPKVHPYVFTIKEFLEMLLNNELNYGKEIAWKNLIFYGASEYFNIINEAINHGFKGYNST